MSALCRHEHGKGLRHDTDLDILYRFYEFSIHLNSRSFLATHFQGLETTREDLLDLVDGATQMITGSLDLRQDGTLDA